jgi:hypothetical protein
MLFLRFVMNFYFAIPSQVSSATRLKIPRQTTQEIKPRNPGLLTAKSRWD